MLKPAIFYVVTGNLLAIQCMAVNQIMVRHIQCRDDNRNDDVCPADLKPTILSGLAHSQLLKFIKDGSSERRSGMDENNEVLSPDVDSSA